jgi:hypothetical protein
MADTYSPTDQEVIVLKSTWDSIDEMVNYAIFMKFPGTAETELHFESSIHQRLFNILLTDFLTAPSPWPFGLKQPPQDALKSMQNILFHLQRVGENPILNPNGGEALLKPLWAFRDWLEAECFVEDVWLPSIELKTDVRVKRFAFIKTCGNIGKHNFARLSRVVADICDILEANGNKVSVDQGYLIIEEFYEWFHDNVFAYHSSAIAEFLNNIRWGIYDYLKPEFRRSFTREPGDSIMYRFKYPAGSEHPTGKSMYWDLMNDVRSEPYMPRFEVTRFLKMRY